MARREALLDAWLGPAALDAGTRETGRQLLEQLAQALDLNHHGLFAYSVKWSRLISPGKSGNSPDWRRLCEKLPALLADHLPVEEAAEARKVVEAALAELPIEKPVGSSGFLREKTSLGRMARDYLDALLQGDRATASNLVLREVEKGTCVKEIYLRVFQPVQREVGRLWQTNRMTVAQEHFCTAATQLIMSQLYPRIFAGKKNGFTLVATGVAGELHEIGIRMVADFFEMEGWNTFYCGTNTPAADVVALVETEKAVLLAVSMTMAKHLTSMREVVRLIRDNPRTRDVKILVGGLPFAQSPDLWQSCQADGTASDAAGAIHLAAGWFGLNEAGSPMEG